MTDKQVKDTKYQYALNSNLVLQGQNRDGSERGPRGGGQDLPSGEGESLVGRMLASFGDKVVRSRPTEDQENAVLNKEAGSKAKPDQHVDTQGGRKAGGNEALPHSRSSVATHSNAHVNFTTLEVNQDLIYRPQTQETRALYQQIVHMVKKHLGDCPIETVKGGVDEVLAVLKDEALNDSRRRFEIDGLLGLEKLSDDEFNSLTILAHSLIDYPSTQPQISGDGGSGTQRYQDQQQQDIAIDLDDEEEAGDGGPLVNEVVEEDQYASEEEHGEHAEEHEEARDKGKESELKRNKESQEPRNRDNEIVEIAEVDAHWIKRKLSEAIEELIPEDLIAMENEILNIIGDEDLSARESEKKLFSILTHKRISLIRTLVKSRHALFYGILLQQAQSEGEKTQIEEQMNQSQIGRQLLLELNSGRAGNGKEDDVLKRADEMLKRSNNKEDLGSIIKDKLVNDKEISQSKQSLKVLDFELLKFQQGSRLMANKKCILPKGSTRLTKPGYEEVYVPAVRQKKDSLGEKLVAISSLPQWARGAFPSYMTHLNRIQSRLYQAAFETPDNLLVCAPTGAGKTNIAMLACLQLLGEMRVQQSRGPAFDLKQLKIIYIAPMKALVSEIVGNFQARLESFGIKVKELTGDVHLTKQQIEETNIIVTTPEKWDIITRKSGDRAYVDLVRLIIIDEVHLLHDSRGPVLESIIARTIRQIEETSELVRIVGLSATLPNYEDVAALLRVDPQHGLYYFDHTYRPVPLEQIFVGITEKKPIKRMMFQNEICYEKVMERADRHQVLVFAHSRKETARTAKIIRDMALAQDKLSTFVKEDSESKKILLEVIVQKKLAVSQDLQDLVPYGIGIHHAGLSKDDRTLVEDLFAAGHIKVLVSTATLAWGVNLPAHTVIIKGTQIYSPEQGKWVELSPQDILQMMGRAGRPQYDTLGEGIIITNHSELQYYLSLNNQQLPIESQMITSLADQLNAEIVLGTVSNLKEAVNWLSYTYLYIRMRRNPDLYGVRPEDFSNDPTLIQTRINLAHSAALRLQRAGMVKYERRTGGLMATALGKVASHYYIKCASMQLYNEELKPHMNTIDIFRLFALSIEFENIPIRENEKVELQKFVDRVPIPVKGSIEEPATKINVLLQAYIARFRLEGYDLNADMVYVTQSASRILRALFEMALKKGWATLAENLLTACKMVERRQWYSMTPLRQFAGAAEDIDLNEIARRIERKEQFRWSDFFEFSAQRLGELVKYPKMGKVILGFVHKFPRLEIGAFVQPITRSTVRIELELKTHEQFQWDRKFHGWAEPFWILVEDGDSEQILHCEQFILKESQVGVEHHLSFTVPLFDPLPPQYFIKVISDRWLQAEHVIPVSFKNLILPEKYAAPTQLLDMHPRLTSELDFEEAAQIYEDDGFKEFSLIQSQAFEKLYQSDASVFLGAPNGGSERRILAELAIFKEIQNENFGKIVYISPKSELCKSIFNNWNKRLGEDGLGLNIELLSDELSGQVNADLAAIDRGDLIICTAEKWDIISRKWRQRKQVLQVSLYIFDDIHLIHDSHAGSGAAYEVVISRVRQIQTEIQKQTKVRIVGLSSPLANAKDVSDWLGVSFAECCFNFHPSVRASCPSVGPLEVNVVAFDHNTRSQRLLQMSKPIYSSLERSLRGNLDSQGIVFVSDRKQARLCALDLANFCSANDDSGFLGVKSQQEVDKLKREVEEFGLRETALKQTIEFGIAFTHHGQPEAEQTWLKQLYKRGVIRVLVATSDQCWSLGDVTADLVIVQDPERYNASERRYRELPIIDLLQMQGLAKASQKQHKSRSQEVAKLIIMCHSPKKDYFTKFISEPLPIESNLPQNLHEHLSAEVCSGTIESIQESIDWITWTYMYRRIVKNPNYYEIAGRTGQHINDFLSELVEDTVADLAESGCISVAENEMDLEPANFGRIAAFYYIKHSTISAFARGLNCSDRGGKVLKMRQLLEVLSASTEFELVLESREADEGALRLLAFNQPYDMPSGADFSEASVKANVLLQSHFSRKTVPPDLRAEQRAILEQATRQTHAMVDVISSATGDEPGNNLRPALLCMELSQMIVQALWSQESPLLQLPYLTKAMIHVLKEKGGVEDIADFMNMEDELREKLLDLNQEQMTNLAAVCNRYPNLELGIENRPSELSVSTSGSSGNSLDLIVSIKRDLAEADFDTKEEYLEELKVFAQPVHAPHYPLAKEEHWWIVVGQPSANRLLSIKKITNMQEQASLTSTLRVEIESDFLLLETPANQSRKVMDLKVYLMCDSYSGCDLEKDLQITLT